MNNEKLILFGMNIRPAVNFIKRYQVWICLIAILFLHLTLCTQTIFLSAFSEDQKAFYQDENGHTYLYGMDPYHYYKQGLDILEGKDIKPNWHVSITLFTHKFLNIFKKTELMQTFFLMPVFISTIAVLIFFFLMRRLTNSVSALFATIFFIMILSLSGRIFAGFADTDPYNILFPLVIVWGSIGGFRLKRVGSMLFALNGFLVGIFSRIWNGWWFIFYIILLSLIIIAIYYLFYKKILKSAIINTVIFFASSAIFVSLFRGFRTFKQAILKPIPQQYIAILGNINVLYLVLLGLVLIAVIYLGIRFIPKDIFRSKKSLIPGAIISIALLFLIVWKLPKFLITMPSSIWPDVFATILELKALSFSQFSQNFGGYGFYFICVLGLMLLIFKKKNRFEKYLMILFLLWFIIGSYTIFTAIRFVVVLMPIMAIFFGLALYEFIERVTGQEIIKMDKRFISLIIFLTIFIYMLIPLTSAYNQIRTPSLNDLWFNSLEHIKNSSTKEAIVSTWWDYGYIINAISDREINFHGGSQNTPAAFWMGKAFSTNDENLSRGIIKMLNCNRNPYLGELEKLIGKDQASAQLLLSILKLNKEDASEFLSKHLSEENKNKLLQLTHCKNPKENFVIVSEDMLFKPAIYEIGNWDFKKAEQYIKLKKANKDKAINILMKDYGMDQDQSEKVYKEIKDKDYSQFMAKFIGYSTSVTSCYNNSNNVFLCKDAIINLTNERVAVKVYNGTNYTQPKSFSAKIDNKVILKEFNNSEINISIILFQLGGKYFSIKATPEMYDAMFTRLFLFEGTGLKNFKKVYISQNILVYKVRFEE